jgi:hypothetical protein
MTKNPAKTKASYYFRLGLKIDAALVLLTILAIVAGSIFTYDGQCGSIIMEPTHAPCNLFQYILTELFIFGMLGLFFLWWAVLIILLLPPLTGYFIGRRRPVDIPADD